MTIIATIVTRGAVMKRIGEIPMLIGLKPDFLHHVDLRISRWTLHQRILVFDYAIDGIRALNGVWFQVFSWAVFAHPQVAKIAGGETGYKRPFFPSHIHIKVTGLLAIG